MNRVREAAAAALALAVCRLQRWLQQVARSRRAPKAAYAQLCGWRHHHRRCRRRQHHETIPYGFLLLLSLSPALLNASPQVQAHCFSSNRQQLRLAAKPQWSLVKRERSHCAATAADDDDNHDDGCIKNSCSVWRRHCHHRSLARRQADNVAGSRRRRRRCEVCSRSGAHNSAAAHLPCGAQPSPANTILRPRMNVILVPRES